ncbi:hypothetical protein [Anaerotignum sp. MB30-C6]|uniref:hypothetical protein n=1 Tax=Anaerotignum sp. MB30-C6 TaxID=3070814 RepID=UPI0027DD77F8|nr:hypothetical protein [Anaerotignum sp. MB30-C6]WMI81665.1 hypothetical protein RBQ60_02695 [Anaerotignum sp. MB30-C6]
MKKISFEQRLNLRLYMNIGCMIVAIILFTFVLLNKEFAYLIPMYSGALSGLFFASLALFFRNRKLRKNPNKMKEKELLETDERNIFITRVSYTIFSYVSIEILFIAMLISGFFSITIFYTLLTLLCVDIVFIFFIRHMVEKMY